MRAVEERSLNILAHRGLWHGQEEKNTLEALGNAISHGFGIETDIRDYQGKLVISHNMATQDCPELKKFFKNYADRGCKEWLALNVKADGLQHQLAELLEEYRICNYFLFDMSIPEMVATKRVHMNFFTRHSDIEHECVLYDDADGVWLDCFYEENWIAAPAIERHLADGKLIAVISPEIHGFDYIPLWRTMREEGLSGNRSVMLCTDKPEEAKEYFDD